MEDSEFKREDRYIVIKRKEMTESQEQGLLNLLYINSIPRTECVVVEPDWPTYEEVWNSIKRHVIGKPTKLEELKSELIRKVYREETEMADWGGLNASIIGSIITEVFDKPRDK